MAALKPEELTAAIRAGKLARVYLFTGPEAFLKERSVSAIIERCLTPESRSLNLDRLNGDVCSGGEVIAAAASVPFLAERRVVIVSAAEKLIAADTGVIAPALPHLPDSTVLVFLYEGKNKARDELSVSVGSAGAIVTFWTPFPDRLVGWAMQEARSRGRALAPAAAAALVEASGDLRDIANELEKLYLFVGKKTAVTLEDVLAHGLPDGSGNLRALEGAVWRRDSGAALREATALMDAGERPEALFPALGRLFRTLAEAYYLLKVQGWPLREVYGELRIKGSTAEENIQAGLKAYRSAEIASAFRLMLDAEYDVKSGRLPGPMALSLLLVRLGRPPASPVGGRAVAGRSGFR